MVNHDKELLVIVDMQNGFINEHTQDLVDKIVHFINEVKFSSIVATRYVNNPGTACYRFEGWDKCMDGTTEAEVIYELMPYINRIFDKSTYSCWTKEFQEYVCLGQFDKVYFIGVNTGCCVLHSVYDCYNSLQDCAVIGDLCGSTSGKSSHERALELLRENITKERVIATDQFYERKKGKRNE